MKNNRRFVCLLGVMLLSGSHTALGGSTFQYILDPAAQTASASGSLSATLVLRETFDGTGSELLDSTDGPGLLSFSTTILQLSSTSGTPATIESVTLDAVFEPLVSEVNLIGPAGAYTGAEVSGAVGLLLPALVDGPALGLPGTLDVPLATFHFTASSVGGDTTSFLSAQHPMASVLPALDGNIEPVDVSFGNVAGQISTITPEPASQSLLAAAALALGYAFRRRSRRN